MSDKDKLLLEAKDLQRILGKLAYRLQESYVVCVPLNLIEPSNAELREFEALTARFERALDILVRAFFRVLDRLEDSAEGTIVDILHRAEKRGLIVDADEFRELRLKRNAIAHDYLEDESAEIAGYILAKTPTLLEALRKSQEYPLR